MDQSTLEVTMASNKLPGEKIPSGYGISQVQNYTPQQMQLFNQGFGSVSPDSYLSKLAGGDQSMFDEMEAPAKRQFNEQLGGIASRFSQGGGGPGAMSSRRSSGFQNASSSAASDFSQQLASNRQNLRMQAIKDLHSMSQQLLGNSPYTRQLYQKDQGGGNKWGSALSGALSGGASGFLAGGPLGALGGAALGGAGGYFGSSGKDSGGFGKEFGDIISNYNKNKAQQGNLGGSSKSPGYNTSGPYGLPTFGGL